MAKMAQIVAFTAVAVCIGCAKHQKPKTTDFELFQKIRVGMKRSEVEKIAQNPKLVLESKNGFGAVVFYGTPPQINSPFGSPSSFVGSIEIRYATNNVVESKHFLGEQNEIAH